MNYRYVGDADIKNGGFFYAKGDRKNQWHVIKVSYFNESIYLIENGYIDLSNMSQDIADVCGYTYDTATQEITTGEHSRQTFHISRSFGAGLAIDCILAHGGNFYADDEYVWLEGDNLNNEPDSYETIYDLWEYVVNSYHITYDGKLKVTL